MLLLIVSVVEIIGLAILTYARAPDRIAESSEFVFLVQLLAAVPLVGWACLQAFFGVGELLGAQVGSAFHLVLALPPVALLYLMWRQPTMSSVALIGMGLAGIGDALLKPATNPPVVLIAGIYLIPGLVLLLAIVAARIQGERMQHR